jgi:GNAT superfamily N-acetyltransferase
MALTQVTNWYLEMSDRSRLRPGRPPAQEVVLTRVEIACPAFSRFLYQTVGRDWYWIDRLEWDDEAWLRRIEQLETWVAYVKGTPAGYFELQPRPDGTVNILIFGLLPWAIGQGLGGWLLTRAIERAWALGPQTVTVNTCSLDGPHALANYQARGFAIARITTTTVDLPDK